MEFTILISLLLHLTTSEKILFLNMWQSKSHGQSMKYLAESLAQEGHQVTMYSQALTSLGDMGKGVRTLESKIWYAEAMEHARGVIYVFWHEEMTPDALSVPFNWSGYYLKAALNETTFNEVLNTPFDLVIVDEMFMCNNAAIALNLRKKFGTKMTLFATTDLMSYHSQWRGLARSPVVAPNYHTKGYHMEYEVTSFLDRMCNVRDYLMELYEYAYPIEDEMRKCGNMLNLDQNFREMFENSYLTISDYPRHFNFPRPISNQYLPIGEHCHEPALLTGELSDFVNDPKSKGTVYMAFGSLLNWAHGPKNFEQPFMEVFNKLTDYRIIWTYQGDKTVFKHIASHIRLTEWAPQKEILSHNKTVLFFTHGGLKSFKEGLCSDVPMLFLPFFADQPKNALLAKHHNLAEAIYKKNVTLLEVETKILRVLSNVEKYKSEVKEYHAHYLDVIEKPLKSGVHAVQRILHTSETTMKQYLQIKSPFISYTAYFFLELVLLGLLTTTALLH